MTRLAVCLLSAAALHQSLAGWAAQFAFPPHTFTLPDGFEIQRVASPPLVDRPIVADFDPQGRLYVADSSGSNDKVEKQLQDKPHRIVRLEDLNGDGVFDRSIVFADKMMFPEGAMWLDGSLYVSAPPSIWKLTDTDGDGVADQRSEWFQGKTLTGCANDLHGPYAGPDGWIYWCKGAFAQQTYPRPGKESFVTRAAHIFRARPDGSGIESVMTGGMDNPVDVAFTRSGERIFTTTFLQHPEAGKRDGLIHAIYGGVYGKVHDVLDGHPRTGDIMPVLSHLGPAAPCGLTRYSSAVFGAEYQNNLFACLFNLHKVTRHVLSPAGATFASQDLDFLTSDQTDFHPTDVLEDADGSLLVIDTGGWYKLCCPTSQLWKPDVLGAIYRIRRTGAPSPADPRGRQLDFAAMTPAALANLFDDPRPAVAERAVSQMARLGLSALPVLKQTLSSSPSPTRRLNAVWALSRIDDPEARAASRAALLDADGDVRDAALNSTALHRDRPAAPRLVQLLKTDSPHSQRLAAAALGRIGNPQAVIPLLAAAGAAPEDRALEHALIYALIEIGDAAGTSAGLRAENPRTQRAALLALDGMDPNALSAAIVAPFLSSQHAALRQTASSIVERHPEWGGALAGSFKQRIAAPNLTSDERQELQRQLTRLARTPAIQVFLAEALQDPATPLPARLLVLRAMAQSGLKETPSSWAANLARILDDPGANDELLRQAVATARLLPAPKENAAVLHAALLQIARQTKNAPEARLEALTSLPAGTLTLEEDLFQLAQQHLSLEKPVLLRGMAAGILGKAKPSSDQLLALLATLKTAGPLELPKLLFAFDHQPEESLGLKLMDALRSSAGVSGLHAENLKPRLAKFPPSIRQQGEQLLESLNLDAPKQKARLEELSSRLKNGDIRRGQAIFNSQKAACASCHAIGYLGGNLGPDLTRIGQIRTERDLLEAIVYPNASFVRSYEPIRVATKSGEEHSGVLRKDSPDEVVLAAGLGAEIRIPRADIADMHPGTVSVMPGGLDEQLTAQELADLIAFLRASK